jgi:hypothetical protein
MKRFLLCLILSAAFQMTSQTVSCPSSLIYLQTSPITVFDPSQPISATNPSNTGIPSGGTGLALCNNLNGGTVSPTFYTTIGNFYAWWNGSSWVTTSHSTGSTTAVNLSGAGCYIYNLVGGTGQVYKYTGTGNGTLLMTEPAFMGGGPYDISSDFDGNFYLLRTATPQWLRMYDFTGTLINTYTLNGMPNTTAGGGFAVMGNTVYANNVGGFWEGIISGTVVTFTNITTSGTLNAGDYANCPTLNTGTISYGISNTGPMGCSGGTVNVMATGFPASATYSWSGPGLAGSPTNSSVPVTAPGIYNCTITPSSGCKTVLSTSVQSSGAVNVTVTPSSTTICQGSSVNLIATGAANYNWSGPALSSTTGSMVTANPNFSSSYIVSGSTGTCSSSPVTLVVNVTTCTGINELNKGIYGLNVFPNPNNGEFSVRATQELELKIVNELGQICKQISLGKHNNFETKVSDLNSGVYFITEGNGRALKDKIVVIRN